MLINPADGVKVASIIAFKIFAPGEGGDSVTRRGEAHGFPAAADDNMVTCFGVNFFPFAQALHTGLIVCCRLKVVDGTRSVIRVVICYSPLLVRVFLVLHFIASAAAGPSQVNGT